MFGLLPHFNKGFEALLGQYFGKVFLCLGQVIRVHAIGDKGLVANHGLLRFGKLLQLVPQVAAR